MHNTITCRIYDESVPRNFQVVKFLASNENQYFLNIRQEARSRTNMLNNHNFFVYLYENLFFFHNEPRQQRIFCWSICFKAIDSEINHVPHPTLSQYQLGSWRKISTLKNKLNKAIGHSDWSANARFYHICFNGEGVCVLNEIKQNEFVCQFKKCQPSHDLYKARVSLYCIPLLLTSKHRASSEGWKNLSITRKRFLQIMK